MNSNDEMPLEVQGLRELLAQTERQLRECVKFLKLKCSCSGLPPYYTGKCGCCQTLDFIDERFK